MNNIFDAIFSNKDSLSFFIFGVVGGIAGVVIRAARANSTDQTKPFFTIVDFILLIVYGLVGGFIALCIGLHIAVSLVSGLFAPLLYDILEKTVPGMLAGLVTKNIPGAVQPTDQSKKEG